MGAAVPSAGEAVSWVNWVPQQPPVIASQMLQLLRLPAGAATSQATAPRTGRLRAFLPILGQLGTEFGGPSPLCQASSAGQGVTSEGGASREPQDGKPFFYRSF